MKGAGTTIVYVFAIYAAVVLLVSLVAWARNRSLADYVLAGRGLGSVVTALSAEAAGMSGWLLLALPGAAYTFGLGAIWIAIGLVVGTYLNWLVVARRLREETQRCGDALTLPGYFAGRFGDRRHTLRAVTALFILAFFVFYTGAGFVAAAQLLERLFGVHYFQALVYGALIVVSYTFIGGFLAIAWNHVFQGALMFFALVLVSVFGLAYVGWLHGLAATLNAVNGGLLHPLYDVQRGGPFTWIALVSLLAWGFGCLGQPHILARFMAIRDPRGIPSARRIALFWIFIVLAAALVAGMAGLGVVDRPLAGADRDRVFVFMSLQLLPTVLAGIALAAVLAAIMAAASAQLLVAASAFAEDVYHAFFRRKAGRRELLWVARLVLAAVAVLAFIVGLDAANGLLLGLVAYAWAGFGAAFGPVVLLSLYWKRMNWAGALAGVVVGGVTVFVWHHLYRFGGIFELYEMVPGVIFSVVAILFFSLLTPRPAGARIRSGAVRRRTGPRSRAPARRKRDAAAG